MPGIDRVDRRYVLRVVVFRIAACQFMHLARFLIPLSRLALLSRMLVAHPITRVWFFHKDDLYTSYQRLSVLFASVYSILAVNAGVTVNSALPCAVFFCKLNSLRIRPVQCFCASLFRPKGRIDANRAKHVGVALLGARCAAAQHLLSIPLQLDVAQQAKVS